MSVTVKFRHPGGFRSLDLAKITDFQITRQRNTCELLAITPENRQPDTPYIIAMRDKEWQLKDILADLERLKNENRDLIYEITATEVHLVKGV
jgi:hypothetical protein